ncbi:MAG: hypothetical protein WC824_13775 [Bacteroidota bacterium]
MPLCFHPFIFAPLALMRTIGVQGYDPAVIMFFFVSMYTVILPLIFGLLGYRKLDKGLRYFFFMLVLVLVTETSAFARGSEGNDNLDIYNAFTALEYFFLMLMFSTWYEKGKLQSFMLYSIPVFLVVWITAKYILKVSDQFDSILLSIESVVFVILSVLTLMKEMRDSRVLLVDNPVFWISSGVLVYFAGNLFVFALIDQLLKDTVSRLHSAWLIHATLNVSKNILYSLGFISTGGPKETLRPMFGKLWRFFRELLFGRRTPKAQD